MIKRNKRSNGLDEATVAAANGRPTELDTAPPDPDSETAWMAEGNCRLHPRIKQAQRKIDDILTDTTLQDILDG